VIGYRRVHHAHDLTSERRVEHLRLSGFVIMKKPPEPSPGDPRFSGDG